MTVYVDDARNRHGRMLMSHMAADTPEELDDMARHLGLRPEWVHDGGIRHYDVSQTKRSEAIKAGAHAVATRGLVKRFRPRGAA